MAFTSAEKYEVLYDLPEGEVSERRLGGVRTRTVRAGEFLEVEAYPLITLEAPAREEYRKRSTSAAQRKINLENARKRVRRLLENNFSSGDFVLHPTFDYGFEDYGFANAKEKREEFYRRGYPLGDDDARKEIRNFIKRVKRYIKRHGGDVKAFKYLYVIEKTKEPRDGDINAVAAHYHYHMAMSGCGVLTISTINELWDKGYTKAEPVDMRFNGLKGLGRYMVKQSRTTRWAKSRNLAEPEIRVSDRKISRRRLAQIAREVQYAGKEIFEKLYPGYRLEEEPVVKYSDFVAGAYIYARMRRIGGDRRSDNCKTGRLCQHAEAGAVRVPGMRM